MNKARRKRLKEAFDKCTEILEILEEVKQEEEEAYENLPDGIRDGDRGEEMQECIEMIEEAAGYIEDAGDVLERF